MRQIIYDVETFPNFFCAAFEDYKTNQRWFFEISDYIDQSKELREFIHSSPLVLIGYNSMLFDNIILNMALRRKCIALDLFKAAQAIIEGQRETAPEETKRKCRRLMKDYKHSDAYVTIDLMRMIASKALRVSLKEMEVSMCWPKVQDLPKHYEELVFEEERDLIKDYNFNDVGATKELCKRVANDIDLRIKIEKEFGLKCLNKDGVRTGVDLFAMFYEEQVGHREFLKQRTNRSEIALKDCISDKVQFKSKPFNDLLNTLKSKVITKTKGALKYSVIYGGVKHDYGTGGIHSKDTPGIIKPRKGEIYMDADVNSLYPSLLIQLKACPAHLDPDVFLPRYEWFIEERLKAKRNSKTDPMAKLISETYKLSLNGTYGNLINEWSWLYDPKAAMMITLNGQLFLSMLSERFTDAGFRVDSLNTDGITCFVSEDKMELYHEICKEWEEHTGLSLEFAEYDKVIRRDVNTYLAIYKELKDKNGDPYVKEKGDFVTEIKLGKGFDKPIVKKALYEYFVKGKNIEETIYGHDNIYDFCMMQKMGSKFKAVWNGERLQKTNRFYAAKGSEAAYLYKLDGVKKSHVLTDSGVIIFNDYVDKKVKGKLPLKEYNINYDYYIREARNIQRAIEPEQLSLFA